MYATKAMLKNYSQLYNLLEINSNKLKRVESIVNLVLENKETYQKVEIELGIPWFFIGAIHLLESTCNFDKHLHNGDSLIKRTIQHPPNRPKKGNPPFTWEESAIDALRYTGLSRKQDWSLAKMLYYLEAYNGWGYRKKHINTPYLWSFSNHYTSGKYVADFTFSSTAVSDQCGAAVLFRRMEERGDIPKVSLYPKSKSFSFFYSNKSEVKVKELQRFLNSLDGITLLVDGIPGKRTSAAFKTVFGNYLKGDPRK